MSKERKVQILQECWVVMLKWAHFRVKHFCKILEGSASLCNIHTGWQKLRNLSTGGAQKLKVRISTKGRVPNIRYFVANSHFVAIYALLRMLL